VVKICFDYGHVGGRSVDCQQLVMGFPADGVIFVVLRNVGGAAYDSRSDLDCDAHPGSVCKNTIQRGVPCVSLYFSRRRENVFFIDKAR